MPLKALALQSKAPPTSHSLPPLQNPYFCSQSSTAADKVLTPRKLSLNPLDNFTHYQNIEKNQVSFSFLILLDPSQHFPPQNGNFRCSQEYLKAKIQGTSPLLNAQFNKVVLLRQNLSCGLLLKQKFCFEVCNTLTGKLEN